MKHENPKRSKKSRRRYFIDLYLQHYIPSHYELKFVPTYACNLSCPYCYTRPFRRHYPGEMSWKVFTKLVGGG
jgi:sulfatase maturation enzyme AslB (radical SAM superfamily)